MSHTLERLLARLTNDRPVTEIHSDFKHATVESALDRGFIVLKALDTMMVYKLTERGRAAIAG
jgi:hypothetical protein